MKTIKKIFPLILTIIICLSCLSCNGTFGYYTFNHTAFNSPLYIEVYDKDLTDQIKSEIAQLITTLEDSFDVENENSLPSRLKNAPLSTNVPLTDIELEILRTTKDYHEYSQGKFNPLLYPLSSLWGFKGQSVNTPPSPEQISEILSSGATKFDNVVIQDNACYKMADCVLDFGGVLKGYASEKICNMLIDNGYTRGYVNIGSSSLTLMYIPILSIVHPIDNSQKIIDVHLRDKDYINVSTSGDYEKFFEHEGVRYSHIIDPYTGASSRTNIKSATLLGNDGAFCDAMTTAICLYEYQPERPYENALASFLKKILSTNPDCSFYVVYSDEEYNHVLTNKKQGSHFTLLDDSFRVIDLSL